MKNIKNSLKNSILLRSVALLSTIFMVNIFFMRISGMEKTAPVESVEEVHEQEQEQIQQLQQLITVELSKKRGLLIFLDEKERDSRGAIGGALETALYQEAGPIIVSTSLLCTLFDERIKNQKSNEVLVDEVTQIGFKNPSWEQNDRIVCSRVSFQPERWVIKKISESLILLLPKGYLELININIDRVLKPIESKQELLDIELELGFKVNHMETIDNIEHIKRSDAAINSDYLIKSLEDIFCKKYDYKDRNISIPEWCIFMQGHGRPRYDKEYFYQYRIVGLSLHGFQNLLAFFESKINIRLLVVLTCFAAGINSIEIYGEMKSATQKYYSFPIVIQGLDDMITTSANPSVDYKAWKVDKTLKLITYRDFASFLKKAALLESDYREIIRPISDEVPDNIAQIKLPGIEWFSIKEIDKKVVSIGSILATTRNPQKPLNVCTYFKKDPEVILLYTDDIPFELQFEEQIEPKKNCSNMEAIVSMISSGYIPDKPGLVINTIKEIRGGRFESIAKWFQLVVSSSVLEYGSKWFFIEQIKEKFRYDKKNILIFGKDLDTVRIYYQERGFIQKGELKGGRYTDYGTCNYEEAKDYKDRLDVVKIYSLYRDIAKKEKVENIKKIEDVLSVQKRMNEYRSKLMAATTASKIKTLKNLMKYFEKDSIEYKACARLLDELD
jgi:hypothetical protein